MKNYHAPQNKYTAHDASHAHPFRFYEDGLATSLVHYALKNPSFAKWATHNLNKRHIKFPEQTKVTLPLSLFPVFTLQTHEDAQRRLLWLIDILKSGSTASPAAEHARASLSLLPRVHTYQEPKDVVIIGSIMTEIIGPVIGDVSPKKKKKKLQVLMRPDIADNLSPKTIEHIHKTTLAVLNQSLKRAHGNSLKIEPEMHDWLYADQALSFFTADANTLSNIESILCQHGIPFAAREDKAGKAILAISPIVEPETLDEIPGIEPISE